MAFWHFQWPLLGCATKNMPRGPAIQAVTPHFADFERGFRLPAETLPGRAASALEAGVEHGLLEAGAVLAAVALGPVEIADSRFCKARDSDLRESPRGLCSRRLAGGIV